MVAINSCCELKIFSPTYAPSGVYKMSKGSFDNSVDAYCDMTTKDGGWIVIQRNKKNSLINFYKNWTEYEKGFGDLNTEFWYGLESMHCLTQRGQWEMRVDYQKEDKTWSYFHYNQFSVGSANEEYPLTVGGFTGVGIDWFTYGTVEKHNGMKFTTADNDNDNYGGNCGIVSKSGWWHTSCAVININYQPPYVYRSSSSHSVLFTEMKIRPKNCIIQ